MSFATEEGLAMGTAAGVLTVVIDRPEKKNALTDQMITRIVDVMHAAGPRSEVRAMLISSAGEDFCTGADLTAPGAADSFTGSNQARLAGHAHELISLITEARFPVVAAVKGWAVGLGLDLALAADFCVAAETSRFWAPSASRGFSPDTGGTWLLPRLVGVARAKELLMRGRQVDGTTAYEWGLVSSLAPSDRLDQEALELVTSLANGPTVTLGYTKALIESSLRSSLREQLRSEGTALELVSTSADFQEGVTSFQERRPPRFAGR
jgi:2-(1,2-epoxy-1,2-dihydrophenyl)acetyl-CoA isomerase